MYLPAAHSVSSFKAASFQCLCNLRQTAPTVATNYSYELHKDKSEERLVLYYYHWQYSGVGLQVNFLEVWGFSQNK